jgi:hypothetical protein
MSEKGSTSGSGPMDNKGKGGNKKSTPKPGSSHEDLQRLVQSAVDKALTSKRPPPSPGSGGKARQTARSGSQPPAPYSKAQLHKRITDILNQHQRLGGGSGPLGPDTNPYSGKGVNRGSAKNKKGFDGTFIASVAHQLTDAIFGETPAERLGRGHTAAENRAEKQIEKALSRAPEKAMNFEKGLATTAKSIGIPLNPNVKFPRTKMSISLSQKKRPENGQMNAVVTLKGTDYLSDVTIVDNSTEGTILYDTLIHPRAFPTTRIAAFAGLFDKYVYRRFTVKYNPSAAADDGGILVGFCDYDPDEDMISAFQENVRKAASHYGMSFSQVFKQDSWTLKELKKDALFFCEPADSEDRLVFQGRFLLLQAADEGTDFLNGIKGLLTVDYEIDFWIPQLADTPVLTTNGLCEFNGDLTTETALLPFGTAPTTSSRSNINVEYSFIVVGGSNYGYFQLPSVATTTIWLITVCLTGTTLSVPVLAYLLAGGLNTITAFQGTTTANTSSTIQYYYSQESGGNRSLVPYLTTWSGATVARISFVPLPTAIALQHNNRKELVQEVDELKAEVQEFKDLISQMQTGETRTLPQENSTPVTPGNPSLTPKSRLPSYSRQNVHS